ncbi:hypothetical protein NT6N_26570 [Oceaniferula spumae]|uniref:non-specific protein-tyrosine kinase n=1 Tax=Oceaniferula spumae TaxID=2979115 RepID=A0AAT9FNR7_9BACT
MNDFADDHDELSQEVKPKNIKGGMTRLRIVLSRWWLMLIFGILGYVIALYTLSIAEPSNKARATLEVVTKKRQLVGSELEQDKLRMEQMMITLANKLVGPSQLTKVVNSPKIQAIEKAVPPEFSFKPKYWRTKEELRYRTAAEASTPEVVKMITGNLQISPRPGTSLIDITVTHKDSTTAVTIADAIMEAYLDSESKRKSGGTTEAFKILRAEANNAEADLEAARRAMSAYNAVMSTNTLMQQKSDEIIKLKQRYKAKHPKLVDAVSMEEELKRRFRGEVNSVLNSPSELEFWSQYRDQMTEYEASIKKAEAEQSEEAIEQAKVAEANWFMLVQRALSSRAGLLQSRISTKQALYDTITKRITEIDVAEENDEGEIKIAEPAYPSGNVQIDKYTRLVQGSVGGVLAGLALAYLLSLMDYKVYDVRTTEEAIGLPCLAAVPESDVFDIEEEWTNVLEAEPNSSNAEAIRNLRASVTLLGKAERHKCLLVTSAVPGEGKTTIASELAAAFALSEQKTLLIDMDLRKPRVHTLFPKLNDSLGMADVLAGQTELGKVIQRTSVDRLHVICAGSKAPNPSELLQDDDIAKIITKLCEHYDRVIIDSPPVLPVSDTRLLVGHVQTVIMVVRAMKAPVGAIMRAKELLQQADAPLVGVVINGMKQKHMGAAYFGYRGYGEYGADAYGGYYEDDRTA